MRLTIIATVLVSTVAAAGNAADQSTIGDAASVVSLLKTHCVDCHGTYKPAGGISLSNLDPGKLTAKNAETWQKVVEVLAFRRMPPADAKQPSDASINKVTGWIKTRLIAVGRASDVDHKLRQPAYANLLSHERLFDGSIKGPAYSPPRMWRLHPQAYENVLTGFGRELNFGGPLSKPFTTGDDKGLVANYASLMKADSATLSQLLLNCRQIAHLQTIGYNRPERRRRRNNKTKKKPRDKRVFRKSPEAFTKIIEGKSNPTDEELKAAVKEEFELVLSRWPSANESKRYTELLRRAIKIGGKQRGLRTMAMAVLLRPEAIYRMEVGLGKPDKHGRRQLSSYELAYAIAYALTDTPPDKLLLGEPKGRSKRATPPSLMDLARDGKLKTRDDVRKVVELIWEKEHIDKTRVLRFFREYFGYHHAATVFKGDRAGREFATKHLIRDADDLVLYHVRRDRDVLKELLTTDKFFVYGSKSKADYERRIQYITKRLKGGKKNGRQNVNYRYFVERTEKKKLRPMPQANPTWRKTVRFYNLDERTWSYPLEQPFAMPRGQRVGILTHPAWLAAWSGNFHNDPIRRGKWIREHLLAGSVPDVPITVDASIPDDPHKTLRQRLTKTRAAYCWKCHQKMDPLGLPFEAYDDFGLFRKREGLGHTKSLRKPKKTAPLVTTGELIKSGDEKIDGKVNNVSEMMRKLASSPRVRQSFVRHAFRYWMGRNERLYDSPTLIAADQSYVRNGGSFKALVLSLLTSDSFLYRK